MVPKQNDKPEFEEMYEVAQLSPIWVDNENGEAIMHGLPKLGFYADKHFLYFHEKGIGKAYYEKTEMLKSAQQAFVTLSNPGGLNKFMGNVESVIAKIQDFVEKSIDTNFESMTLQELLNPIQQQLKYDLEIFSLYDATQPQNFTLFEKEIRLKLAEKISDETEIDSVLAALTGSHKETEVSREELSWLKIILKAKQTNQFISKNDLANQNPHIHKLVTDHFDKYKLLTIGDGHWEPNIDHFLENFETDQNRDLQALQDRISELETAGERTQKIRKELIDKYSIESETLHYCDVIAEIGHVRFTMRTNGFILLANETRAFMQVASLLGIELRELFHATADELRGLINKPSDEMLSVLKKRAKEETYLMEINDTKRMFYFGNEAKQKYCNLVQLEDYSELSEFQGNPAMAGKIKGTALVFQWGDDIQEAIKGVKGGTILIAGQTRPQLMPLIRACVGIITDEGGITSHAAIVARELKMPCLVGSKVATKSLQTGDEIELDADKGVVRIIKKVNL